MMTIHREGFKILTFFVFLLVALNYGIYYLFPLNILLQQIFVIVSLVFYLILLQFFRNPQRNTTVDPNHIIAPADGKVVVIEETVENEYFNEKKIQVSIFMSPFNVHVNRNPVAGIINYFKYHPGKFLVAWHPKSSTENERTTIVIKTHENNEILFRQIAGALAKRIKWYVKPGLAVKQGAEFGFIKFGSRVDVFLPLDAVINVKIGEKTVGGKTILANFNSQY